MALSAPILSFPYGKLIPLYPGDANEIPVNLPPNSTILKGTILGQVTTAANDVQTVTITGAPTGGTFTLTTGGPAGTGSTTFAYNASTAAVQAALVAIYGTGTVAVTGTAGSSYVITFGGTLGNVPVTPITASGAFTGGTSPAIAVAHTTTGATAGTWAAYASGNSDGTQAPELILAYTVTTGSNGEGFFGNGTSTGEWGQSYRDFPAYRKGTFRTSDLVGLDSNAVTKMGRLVAGTVSSGILQLI